MNKYVIIYANFLMLVQIKQCTKLNKKKNYLILIEIKMSFLKFTKRFKLQKMETKAHLMS